MDINAVLTSLRQETAGFILGENAYRDPLLNRSNPNPEAFRDADSQRLYAVWSNRSGSLEVRPYFRHSDMTFLQHFLPGKPLEQNGHRSAGVLISKRHSGTSIDWSYGADIEWADVYLRQAQDQPTQGSPFLQETRPAGRHYDYDVTAWTAAPWAQFEYETHGGLIVDVGVRGEVVRYNYRNNLLDGNSRDDGSACGFGGCLYTRPGDRSDRFSNLAPKIGLRRAISANTTLYARLARGFRAPQITELYRLQSGQNVADLEAETIDSFELGWRRFSDRFGAELTAYWQSKRGSVLRDADGFNVSNGRSRHYGLESSIDWQPTDWLQIRVNGTYARHQYDFNLVAARGETFSDGNDVDTAPRWLGSAEVRVAPRETFDVTLGWNSVGRYFLDAENSVDYPGHDIVNLRARWQFHRRYQATVRANNVFDTDYARPRRLRIWQLSLLSGAGPGIIRRDSLPAMNPHNGSAPSSPPPGAVCPTARQQQRFCR